MTRVWSFFSRILDRIRLGRLRRQLRRSARRMASQLDGAERWLLSSQERLEKAVEQNRRESDEIQATISALRANVDDLANNQRIYESELEELREKLQIAEKITIPGMVQGHELLLQRFRALTQAEIQKQVAIRPQSD